jgi:hypothetical protein
MYRPLGQRRNQSSYGEDGDSDKHLGSIKRLSSRKDHVPNASPGPKEFTNYYTENALDCAQAEP